MPDTSMPVSVPAVLSPIWSAYQLAVFADIRDGKGHTFVGAVAGSGKSTTIVAGLEHIPQGLKTLFCAFGKEATVSLAKKLTATPWAANVQCSTTHSFGMRQITRCLGRAEVDEFKTYRIIDQLCTKNSVTIGKEVQASLVKTVSLCKCTLSHSTEEIENVVSTYGIEIDPEGDSQEEYTTQLANFVRRVHRILEEAAAWTEVIDFDDMIWLPVRLNLRVWQFDRIFIDEFQDLNPCQHELAFRACKSNGRILAVGDKNQCIYQFRAADEKGIEKFVERFRAKELLLSVCYRCPKSVIREAQKYVPQIEYAPNAVEGSVTKATTESMLKQVQPGDFILSRTNAPLISLCLGLLAEGRRAMVTGRKDISKNLSSLIRKSKCKDVRSFLEWLDRWQSQEIGYLAGRMPPLETQIEVVQDKAACLQALCEGAQSLNEVDARIVALFSDLDEKGEKVAPENSRVILSTTHRAKGLERKNVFLLRDTYLRRSGSDAQETNLYYVAVTRAQENLCLVYKDKEIK